MAGEYPLDSFIFYRSFREALEEMNDSDKLVTVLAICDYALYGVEPHLESAMPRMAFTMAKPNIDANYRNRKNGGKGGRPPKEKPGVSKNENRGFTKSKTNEDEDVDENGDVNADEESKADKPPARFPPTEEMVRAYIDEHDYAVDAAAFVDYYTANGWVQGKGKPIKDWKAAVRTWARREKNDDVPESRMELVTHEDGTKTWRMKS